MTHLYTRYIDDTFVLLSSSDHAKEIPRVSHKNTQKYEFHFYEVEETFYFITRFYFP